MQNDMPQEDDDRKVPGEKPAGKQEKSAVQEKKQPGKVNQFMRRTTRMLVTAALLVIAGIVTGYVAFQRPQAVELSSQVAQLTTEKTDLEARVAALEADVEALEPLETENESLQALLDDERLHVGLLSALKDVQQAQLNLALEQVDAARVSLSRTEEKLGDLQELLPADQQGVVDGMVQRLNLVLDGMSADAFAAQSDLEVLANSLLQLENTLFASP